MVDARGEGNAMGETKNKKREVENYTHAGKERVNNPPVGLVTPETDKDAGEKTYAHDPHLESATRLGREG